MRRGFAGNEDGAAAIEFALLAFPFFLLIFAVIESCVAFAAQQLLSNATTEVGRQFRTGQIKVIDNVDEAMVKDMVCKRIRILTADDCPGLEVDLQQFDTFQEAANKAPLDPDGNIATAIDLGESSTKNMLRTYYRWPVLTNRLAATLPDGKMLLFAADIWQNEPFDDDAVNGGSGGGV